MRPAIPGAVLVFGACVCLLLVTISTPVLKSLSFLDATATGSNQNIRLGCLGYCVGSTCTSPSIGWSFDPNELLGVSDVVPAGWGRVAIKGLTYTLVLHPVALAGAVLTLVLGLFTACRGSTGCCTSIIAGLAAGITIVAFGLDLALFLIAKKRIEAIGGSAQLGAALWLTLAAWVLLIVSTCLTSCNSCCGGGGGRNHREKVKDSYGAPSAGPGGFSGDAYGERMRLEALEAERRRKGPGEAELPKFAVYETEHVEHLPAEESRPLNHDYDQGYGAGRGAGYARHNNVGGYGADPYAHSNSYGNMAPYGEQAHYSNSPAMGYAAGVGPGQRRGAAPEAQSVNSGYAGYGAHAPNRAPTTPSRHNQEPTYTPGVGPQPYRDGVDGGSLMTAAAVGTAAGAGAGYAAHRQNSHDPYADQQQYGDQQQQYGDQQQYANAGGYHAAEATFGVPQRSASTVSYNDPAAQSAYGHAQSAYGHEQSSAYTHDVVGQQAQPQQTEAYCAGAPPRRLPSVPAGGDARRQGTNATTDDGFGLAVLQAGAAAAQRQTGEGGVSPHDDAHRAAVEAAYGQHHAIAHQQQASANQYGQQHDAYEAQGYADGGEAYGDAQGYAPTQGSSHLHKSLPPPGYEANAAPSHAYPREKR